MVFEELYPVNVFPSDSPFMGSEFYYAHADVQGDEENPYARTMGLWRKDGTTDTASIEMDGFGMICILRRESGSPASTLIRTPSSISVHPIVDGLGMILAVRERKEERNRLFARVDFAPRIIFHIIAKHIPDHTVDDTLAKLLFDFIPFPDCPIYRYPKHRRDYPTNIVQ